jgi:hypothetical protein
MRPHVRVVKHHQASGFVESLVVSPARDRAAAVIFMDDFWSRLASRVQPTRTLKLLIRRPWEMSEMVDVLEAWEWPG